MTKNQNFNPAYNVQRIINRELTFRSIDQQDLVGEIENPKINVNVAVNPHSLGKELFGVEIKIDITATLEKLKKEFFFIDLKTIGYFHFENPPMDENFERILHIFCPSVIFPYMRETIDGCLVKAGFAPLLMNPINFEGVYYSKKQQNEVTTTAKEQSEILKLKAELEALKNQVSAEKGKEEHLEGLKAKTKQLKSKK